MWRAPRARGRRTWPHREERRDGGEHERIERLHLIERLLQQPAGGEGAGETEGRPLPTCTAPERSTLEIARRVLGPNRDERLRVRIRERAQHDGLQHAEKRGAGADGDAIVSTATREMADVLERGGGRSGGRRAWGRGECERIGRSDGKGREKDWDYEERGRGGVTPPGARSSGRRGWRGGPGRARRGRRRPTAASPRRDRSAGPTAGFAAGKVLARSRCRPGAPQ